LKAIESEPVSEIFKMKQALTNAQGSNADYSDVLKYTTSSGIGSMGSMMAETALATFGRQAFIKAAQVGLTAAGVGIETGPGAIAVGALATLGQIATSAHARWAETKSESGEHIEQAEKALTEKWMKEHPDQEPTEEDLREIRINSMKGVDQLFWQQMSLAVPDMAQAMIGSSLFKGSSIFSGLNKVGNYSKGTRIAKTGTLLYGNMMEEKAEEGFQYATQKRALNKVLDEDTKDGLFSKILTDYWDTASSVNLNLPYASNINLGGKYADDKEFQAASEAGGLLGMFGGGIAGVAKTTGELNKFYSVANELKDKSAINLDAKMFKLKDQIYFKHFENDTTEYLLEGLRGLNKNYDDKGQKLLSDKQLVEEVKNITDAAAKYNEINNFGDNLVKKGRLGLSYSKEQKDMLAKFKSELFNQSIQLTREGKDLEKLNIEELKFNHNLDINKQFSLINSKIEGQKQIIEDIKSESVSNPSLLKENFLINKEIKNRLSIAEDKLKSLEVEKAKFVETTKESGVNLEEKPLTPEESNILNEKLKVELNITEAQEKYNELLKLKTSDDLAKWYSKKAKEFKAVETKPKPQPVEDQSDSNEESFVSETNYGDLINKATSNRELDKILDQADEEGLTNPELIDLINKKRDSLPKTNTTTVEFTQEQNTSENTNNDLESKKADIERRRQEELFKPTQEPKDSFFKPQYENGKNLVNEALVEKTGSDLLYRLVDLAYKGTSAKEIAKVLGYKEQEIKDIRTYLSIPNTGISKGITGVISEPEDIKAFEDWKSKIDKINAKYDAKYVDAVKKGEMTKEQAIKALEEIGRKNSSAYAELAALENSNKESDSSKNNKEGFPNTKSTAEGETFIPNKLREKLAETTELMTSKKVQEVIDRLISEGKDINDVAQIKIAEFKGEKSIEVWVDGKILFFIPAKKGNYSDELQNVINQINSNIPFNKSGLQINISNGYIKASENAITLDALSPIVKTNGDYVIIDQGTDKKRAEGGGFELIRDGKGSTTATEVAKGMKPKHKNLGRYILSFIEPASGVRKFIAVKPAKLTDYTKYLDLLFKLSSTVVKAKSNNEALTVQELADKNNEINNKVFIAIPQAEVGDRNLEIDLNIDDNGDLRVNLINVVNEDNKAVDKPILKKIIKKEELTDSVSVLAKINDILNKAEISIEPKSFRNAIPKGELVGKDVSNLFETYTAPEVLEGQDVIISVNKTNTALNTITDNNKEETIIKDSKKADIERRRQGLNGVEEIIFNNPNFRLEGFEIDGNYWNVVTSTDRAKVLVNINGVIVPFYLTTGQAGKGLIPGWYPFFGIGKDGWLNKTDKSDMETYYERYWGKEVADIVKSISEELNSFYGTDPTTFKNDGDPNATSRPLSTLADKVEDYINSKLNYTPAINDADARKTLRSNVEQLGKEINAKYDAELADLESKETPKTPVKEIDEFDVDTDADPIKPNAPTTFKLADSKVTELISQVELDEVNRIIPKETKVELESDFKEFVKNVNTSGTAWGYFRDNIISLWTGAQSGTGYHEAFHAIFRTAINNKDVNRFLKLAEIELKGKYTAKELDTKLEELRKSSIDYLELTNAQLKDLMLEEYLADKFADWKKSKSTKSLTGLRKFFERFNEIVNLLFTNKNTLEAFFNKIDRGAFSSTKAIPNKQSFVTTTAFKNLISGVETSMSSTKSKKIINTFAARVRQESRKAGVDESNEEILDRLINERLASLNTKGKEYITSITDPVLKKKLLKSWKEEVYSLKNDVAKELLVEQVNKKLKIFDNKSDLAEENEEGQDNEKGGESGFGAKESWTLSLEESTNKVIKEYIAFAMYKTVDELTGELVDLSVDAQTIYNGLGHILANTEEDKMMDKFIVYSKDNEQAKAVLDMIMADTGMSYDANGLMSNPSKNFNDLRKIITAFKNSKITFLHTGFENGEVTVGNANMNTAERLSVSEWVNNVLYIKRGKQADKQFWESKIEAGVSAFTDIKNKFKIITDKELDEQIKDVQKKFAEFGITLSSGYLRYSILSYKNTVSEGEALSDSQKNDIEVFNDNNTKPLDILTIKGDSSGYSLYDYLPNDKDPFEEGKESDKMGGKIKAIAKNNGLFDESLAASNFKGADGNTRYDLIKPSYVLDETQRLRSPEYRDWLKNKYEILKDNLLFRNNTFLNNLQIDLISGVRDQSFSDNEGKVFGDFSEREYLMQHIGYWFAQRNNQAYTLFRQNEAANTAYVAKMPVDNLVNDKGLASDKAVDQVYSFFKAEYNRIGREKAKGLGNIKGYNNNDNGRAFRFTEFANLAYSIGGLKYNQLTEDARVNAEISKDLESDIKKAIENSLNYQIKEFKEILANNKLININNGTITPSKIIPKTIGGKKLEGNDLNNTLGNMYLNDYINSFSLNQLFDGDYALSRDDKGVKEVLLDENGNTTPTGVSVLLPKQDLSIDIVKRNKGAMGSGSDLGKGTHRVAFIKDINVFVNGKKDGQLIRSDKGDKINSNDAQSYTNINHAMFITERLGKMSDDVRTILRKIRRGIDVTSKEQQKLEDSGASLNPFKTVTFGREWYIKTSEALISRHEVSYITNKEKYNLIMDELESRENTKELTKQDLIEFNKELVKLYKPIPGKEYYHEMLNQMDIHGIDQIVAESASKGATIEPVDTLADGFDLSKSMVDIDNSYKRLQVETPTGKNSITDGTQLMQLIDSEQDDSIEVVVNGKSMTIGEVRKQYRTAMADTRDNSFKIASQYIKYEGNKVDTKKLRVKFLKALEASGADEQLLEIFGLNWNLLPAVDKAEQLFLSHFGGGVLAQKVPGTKVAMMSDAHWNVVRDDNGKVVLNKIVKANPEKYKTSADNKLNYLVKPNDIQELNNEKRSKQIFKFGIKNFGSIEVVLPINKNEAPSVNWILKTNQQLNQPGVSVNSYKELNNYLQSLGFLPLKSDSKNISKGALGIWETLVNEGLATQIGVSKINKPIYQFKTGVTKKYIDNKLLHNARDPKTGQLYSECVLSERVFSKFGLKIGDEIPVDLATMLGYRIPTQDKHSMTSLRVVDVLPNYLEGTGIFPAELVLLSGADFDIDSLFIQQPSFWMNNGVATKAGSEKTNKERFDSFLNYIKEDKLFKIEVEDRLLHNSVMLAYKDVKKSERTKELKAQFADAKDSIIKGVLMDWGLPTNEIEYVKYIANNPIPNNNALNNNALDYKLALLTNKGIEDVALEPVSSDALIEEARYVENDLKTDNKKVLSTSSSLIGKAKAFFQNSAGKAGIGPVANSLQAFTLLAKNKIRRSSETPLIIDGVELSKFDYTSEKETNIIDETKKINIWAGSNENSILSNLAIRPFTFQGDSFNSVEEYFQIQKSNYLKEELYLDGNEAKLKEVVEHNNKVLDEIIKNENNPFKIKLLGRQFKGLDTKAWDKVALSEMEKVLKISFEQNPKSLEALKNTGNSLLTHTQDSGRWKNDFPNLLMKVRNDLFGNKKSKRVADTLSTILSVMTDNAKDPIAGKIGLTLELLTTYNYLVSLGVPLRTITKIINTPSVQMYANLLKENKYSLKTEDEKSGTRNEKENKLFKEILKKEPNKLDLEATGEIITTDLESIIKEGLNDNNRVENFNILREFMAIEKEAESFQDLNNIIKLTKGLPTSFNDTSKGFVDSLHKLKINNLFGLADLDRFKDEKPAFDITEAVKNDPLLFNNIKNALQVLKYSEGIFITETKPFKTQFETLLANLKDNISKDTIKELRRSFLGHVSTRAYINYMRKTNADFNPANDGLLFPKLGEETLGKQLVKLKSSEDEAIKNNSFIKWLKVDLGFPVDEYSGVVYDKVSGKSFIKLSVESINDIVNSFNDLWRNPETKDFAENSFHYLLTKDNLEFRNDSFVKYIAPLMFTNVSKGLNAELEALLNGDGLVEFNEISKQFRALNAGYIPTQGNLKKIELSDKHQDEYVFDYAKSQDLFDSKKVGNQTLFKYPEYIIVKINKKSELYYNDLQGKPENLNTSATYKKKPSFGYKSVTVFGKTVDDNYDTYIKLGKIKEDAVEEKPKSENPLTEAESKAVVEQSGIDNNIPKQNKTNTDNNLDLSEKSGILGDMNIIFEEEQSSGYRERTIKNASADATIAIAVDFTTAGERLTKSSVINQGKKYLPVVISNESNAELEQYANKIIDELNKIKPSLFGITLNIAGNGIYTFDKNEWDQNRIDEFVFELLGEIVSSSKLKHKIISIRTGGQTGVDEAGAKAGIRLGIPTTILAPKGWVFRDINSKDISNEHKFKDRFKNITLSNYKNEKTDSGIPVSELYSEDVWNSFEQIKKDYIKKCN